MKKILLPLIACAMSTSLAFAQDPEFPGFPEEFGYSLSCPGLEVSQGDYGGFFTFLVEGECTAEEVTVTLEVPTGWDGFITKDPNASQGGATPYARAKMDPYEPEENPDWVPVEDALKMGYAKLNSVTFKVTGEWQQKVFYLYVDGMMDSDNGIQVDFKVTKKIFPDAFTVELNCAGPKVAVSDEPGMYTISVTGECTEDNVNVMVAVPDGWEGFVVMSGDDMGQGGINPLGARRAAADDEEAWAPLEAMLQYGFKQADNFLFKADGEDHMAQMYLYRDGQVYQESYVRIEANVTKIEVAEFPEDFTVDLNCSGPVVAVDAEQDVYSISVTGDCTENNVNVMVGVPEGWDGFLVGVGEDMGDVEPAPLRIAPDDLWTSVDNLLAAGFKQADNFLFPADGEEHTAQMYLYKGSLVYQTNHVEISGKVTKIEVAEFPDSFTVELNCEGPNVAINDDQDVHTVSVTGDCTEDNVNVMVGVPEGWDGFMVKEGEDSGIVEPARIAPADEDWSSMADMEAAGFKKADNFLFKADGEEHTAQMYLYKGSLVYVGSHVEISGKVTKIEVAEFPDSFTVELNCEGPKVAVNDDQDVHTITVTGDCMEDNVNVMVGVPEGWDGFMFKEGEDSGLVEPAAARIAPADDAWSSMADMEAAGFKKADNFLFKADGEEHTAQMYLYKGTLVYVGSHVEIEANVTKIEVAEFPEDFTVELNCSGPVVAVDAEQEVYSISVTGDCTEDNVNVMVGVPEGWDGFVVMTDGEQGSVEPARIAPADDEWASIDNLLAAGYKKADNFLFPADGEDHTAQMYLYKGTLVYVGSHVEIEANVSKIEVAEFPDSFAVELNCEGPQVAVSDDQDVYTITVTGDCMEDNVNVMVGVPEGWDGFMFKEGEDSGIVEPARIAPADDEWSAMADMEAAGFKKADNFLFKADGEEHTAQMYLYKGSLVYVGSHVEIEGKVSKLEVAEFPEDFAVELNCEGPQVAVSDDQDVYTITVTGDCTEDNVNVMVGVPEGWDGFVVMADGEQGSVEPARIAPADDEWVSIDNLLAAGYKKADNFLFPTDGEDHTAQMYLYNGSLVYVGSHVEIQANVTKIDVTEFPDDFAVELNCEGPQVAVSDDQDVYTITVTGDCMEDNVNVMVGVPEDWDGFIVMAFEDMGGIEPLRAPLEPGAWSSLDDMLVAGFKKADNFLFKADGEEHFAQMYLYKGSLVYVGSHVEIEGNVSKIEAPEFPAEFEVELSCDGPVVTQDSDQDVVTVSVTGQCTEANVNVMVAVPEDWDGFVVMGFEDMGDIEPLRAPVDLDAWSSLDDMLAAGFKKGDNFLFPADGEFHFAQMYLYKGSLVYVGSHVEIEGTVSQPEMPAFPTEIGVTLSNSDVTVDQGDEDGALTIRVSGECEDDDVTVTFEVPEGWDGFLVQTSDDNAGGNVSPLANLLPPYEPMTPFLVPVESLLGEGFQKANSVTFKTDGEEHYAEVYLYKGDVADVANLIYVEFNVTALTGVSEIELDPNARYYTIQGVEVRNPGPGIYVKISDGKTSKVNVK